MFSKFSNFSGPISSYKPSVVANIPKSLLFTSSNKTYLSGTIPSPVRNGPFTLEAWFKSNNENDISGIISFRINETQPFALAINLNSGKLEITSGSEYALYTIAQNTWNHVAVVRDNDYIVSTYINGILIGTFGDSRNIVVTDFVIGRYWTDFNDYYFDGLITNIRLNFDVVYSSNFIPPLEKLIDDEFTQFLIPVDSSSTYNDITRNVEITEFGGVELSNILPTLPYGSYRFGLNDTEPRYISIPASEDWAFGYDDFTVEWFQYQTQASPPSYSRLFQVGGWPNQSFAVSIENGLFLLWLNNSSTYYVGLEISNYLNKWIHFAISRVSGQVSVWQDGTKIWNGTVNTDITNNYDNFQIGYGSDNVWNGYVTNFRLVTGTYVYDVNDNTITVPTTPLTNVTGTKLLLLFSDPNNLIDLSPDNRTITNYGATWSNLTPF